MPSLNITDARKVILENIRQKCIYLDAYNLTGEPNIKSNKYTYWDYMDYFYNDCIKSNPPKFSYECSEASMIKANINNTKIEECILDSFNLSILIY